MLVPCSCYAKSQPLRIVPEKLNFNITDYQSNIPLNFFFWFPKSMTLVFLLLRENVIMSDQHCKKTTCLIMKKFKVKRRKDLCDDSKQINFSSHIKLTPIHVFLNYSVYDSISFKRLLRPKATRSASYWWARGSLTNTELSVQCFLFTGGVWCLLVVFAFFGSLKFSWKKVMSNISKHQSTFCNICIKTRWQLSGCCFYLARPLSIKSAESPTLNPDGSDLLNVGVLKSHQVILKYNSGSLWICDIIEGNVQSETRFPGALMNSAGDVYLIGMIPSLEHFNSPSVLPSWSTSSCSVYSDFSVSPCRPVSPHLSTSRSRCVQLINRVSSCLNTCPSLPHYLQCTVTQPADLWWFVARRKVVPFSLGFCHFLTTASKHWMNLVVIGHLKPE